MGENKMETVGKDTAQVECKQPDDNEGGIRRRLRDRDLLRKRRAEAEEKAIYHVESKRRKESTPGRRGRPKKIETDVVPQPAQEGAPSDGRAEEELLQGAVPSQAEEQLAQDPAQEEQTVIPDSDKAEESFTANVASVTEAPPADTVDRESVPPQVLLPPLYQPLVAPPAPDPQPEVIPPPVQEQAPPTEGVSSLPKDEVTIEDLGPDDEADDPSSAGDQGAEAEPVEVTDSSPVFSISSLVSPPQPSYLPGPSL